MTRHVFALFSRSSVSEHMLVSTAKDEWEGDVTVKWKTRSLTGGDVGEKEEKIRFFFY